MKEPMWGTDPYEDREEDMSVPPKIIVTGVFAYAHIWGLGLAFPLLCTGDGLGYDLAIGMILFSVLSHLVMGTLFTIHVWRSRHKSGGERLLWTIGLLVFFAAFNIPYYWHREIWQPFQAKRYSFY